MVFEYFNFKHGIQIDAGYVSDIYFYPIHIGIQNYALLQVSIAAPVAAFLNRYTEVHNFIYQIRIYLKL